jgi:hypothetical protein
MEEDDIVKSMAIALYRERERERRTDKEGRAVSPRSL